MKKLCKSTSASMLVCKLIVSRTKRERWTGRNSFQGKKGVSSLRPANYTAEEGIRPSLHAEALFIELSEVPIPRKCERIGNGESVGFVTDRTVTCRPKIGLIYSPSTHSQVAWVPPYFCRTRSKRYDWFMPACGVLFQSTWPFVFCAPPLGAHQNFLHNGL